MNILSNSHIHILSSFDFLCFFRTERRRTSISVLFQLLLLLNDA